MDVLDFIDIVDYVSENSNINYEDMNYLNEKLKEKLSKDNYSVSDILLEKNIINDNSISDSLKESRLKKISLPNIGKGYNYSYKDPKKTAPKDLKKYKDRTWVKSIVSNPVEEKDKFMI